MTDTAPSPGPLRGLRVVEIAALGSAPFAAMMLADAGAEVLRINRPGQTTDDAGILGRGRTTLSLDLKDPCERDRALDAIDRADVLIEGFRPGVMERLGLGPDTCLGRNPALIYARMTGWGQDGPLADTAGHDLNYLALTGALRSIARQGEVPVPPLNLVGDYGGGGMLLVTGILAALYERVSSNVGQVVDAAMIDGTSLLMSGIWNRKATGNWSSEPGTNSIDSGAHFYNVYRTSDDAFMAVGSIEPQFYQRLLLGLGLADADLPAQQDRAQWPAMKDRFASIFRTKTREEWTVVFAELDACVSPVLTLDEAVTDPHMQFRNTLIRGERVEPAPAPRYSRTPGNAGGHGENTEPATTLMTRCASTDCTTPATTRTGQH
ncbi:CaiB/BaiF CoA-transferase family protein [Rhodococcus sp. A14]|uniref:CoA transferase n=1 Tax=Rhodococcus sp. A14 TaxID=1194106 RepID=UPI0014241139|nr:CoA transferase [Rhodococcus sp. A14]